MAARQREYRIIYFVVGCAILAPIMVFLSITFMQGLDTPTGAATASTVTLAMLSAYYYVVGAQPQERLSDGSAVVVSILSVLALGAEVIYARLASYNETDGILLALSMLATITSTVYSMLRERNQNYL